MDSEEYNHLKMEIQEINERLKAIEKEQRLIIEDILSGEAEARIRKRILDNPTKYQKNKENIDEKIDIKI